MGKIMDPPQSHVVRSDQMGENSQSHVVTSDHIYNKEDLQRTSLANKLASSESREVSEPDSPVERADRPDLAAPYEAPSGCGLKRMAGRY